MRILGNFLPYIGRVIAPCSRDGNPAMTDEEAENAHFERGCLCLAWIGLAVMFPFGDVQPRLIDPENPRRYAPGSL